MVRLAFYPLFANICFVIWVALQAYAKRPSAPKDYDPIMRRLDMMVNRLLLTLLIMSLIIAASIVMVAYLHNNPTSNPDKLPTLSIIALVLAGFFMILLWRAIRRSRKS
jgi:hypothetical protein